MSRTRFNRRSSLEGRRGCRGRSLRHHLDRAGQRRHAAGQRTRHARAHRLRRPRAALRFPAVQRNAGRRHCRPLSRPSRGVRPADQRQGLRRLPRASGPERHRRRDHRHARPLARADRHPGGSGEEGRLWRKAARIDHRARPCLPEGLSRRPAASFSTARSSAASRISGSAANWSAADESARCIRSK